MQFPRQPTSALFAVFKFMEASLHVSYSPNILRQQNDSHHWLIIIYKIKKTSTQQPKYYYGFKKDVSFIFSL